MQKLKLHGGKVTEAHVRELSHRALARGLSLRRVEILTHRMVEHFNRFKDLMAISDQINHTLANNSDSIDHPSPIKLYPKRPDRLNCFCLDYLPGDYEILRPYNPSIPSSDQIVAAIERDLDTAIRRISLPEPLTDKEHAKLRKLQQAMARFIVQRFY